MCWVAATTVGGSAVGTVRLGVTGKFFYLNPSGTQNEIPLPSGVAAVLGRPTGAYDNTDAKSRMYLVGGWTDNLVLTEQYDLARQAILPPPNPIINNMGGGSAIGVEGGSSPGITGEITFYVSWYDARNRRRSALSGPSPSITFTDQIVEWTNLPTNPRDPTVTHIELWHAVDGNSPRLAVRRDLGTTTVDEAIAEGLLGEAITEDTQRFPRCRFNANWHDRQVMAGDDRHPDRLYFSPIGDHENYAGLFLRTRKGEKITGIVPIGDFLVVLSQTSSYVVTGYTEDDLKMDVLEPLIGGIGHHLCANVDGWAIIPSQRGIYLCTGSSMHLISKEFQHTWRQHYRDNRNAYEDAWAVNDIETNTYKLCVQAIDLVEDLYGPHVGQSVEVFDGDDSCMYWVLDYTDLLSETGGGFRQPALTLDYRRRVDHSANILRVPGSRRGELYVGSDDGTVRQEQVSGGNDDGSAVEFYVRFGHLFMDAPGGSPLDGWDWRSSWIYANLGASDDMVVRMFGGDEQAWKQLTYSSETFQLSDTEQLDLDDLALDDTCVFLWQPMVSGRGQTLDISITSPSSDFNLLGHGGVRGPGSNNRGHIDVEEV